MFIIYGNNFRVYNNKQLEKDASNKRSEGSLLES